MDHSSGNPPIAAAENDSNKEEQKLDQELRILRKLKLALAASLPMLEAAQHDLVEMGNRLDRLRIASERCRAALEKNNNGTTITKS